MIKKTKIICTIGPACESKEMLNNLMKHGMNIARLNFSHGNHEDHAMRIKRIREVAQVRGDNIAILLDTKGPEVRLGILENEEEAYQKGEELILVKEEVLGTHQRIHVRCPEIFSDTQVGGTILVDDGKMRLSILEKNDAELRCRIENPGLLKSNKGCNLPNVKLSMPFLSTKDEGDIRFGCHAEVDYIAASFTRRAEDVEAIRSILKEEGKEDIQIIPKIENQEGFDNLESILKVSDGVMVARGDLGVDVSFEYVPIYQKIIIKTANRMGKPVITATHMLESMQGNPRPTRAEAGDVANAILDGSDAIMLSGESAAGMYPIEAVTTMNKIAVATEQIIDYKVLLDKAITSSMRTKNDAIAISAADTALAMDIAFIVAFTQSGNTVRRIAKCRPKSPIIGIAFDAKTRRSLSLDWGVTTFLSNVKNDTHNESQIARHYATIAGAKKGDTILIIAGYPTGEGHTNTMRIIEV